MSQRLTSDYHIDPNSTNGTELADILNRAVDALDTLNAGVSRPAYARRGTIWLDESDIAAHSIAKIMLFDGAKDVLIGNINTASGIFKPPQLTTGFKNVLINGDFRVNQRGFNGNWGDAAHAVNAYGFDRWRKIDDDYIDQPIEEINLIPNQDYVLSWEGGGTGRMALMSGTGTTGVSPLTLNVATISHPFARVPHDAKNVQFEKGKERTDFEIRNIQMEKAMCERYFNKIIDATGNATARIAYGMASSASTVQAALFYPEMRVVPSVNTEGNFSIVRATGATAAAALTFSMIGTNECRVVGTGTGLVAGNAGGIVAAGVSAKIFLDAEIHV